MNEVELIGLQYKTTQLQFQIIQLEFAIPIKTTSLKAPDYPLVKVIICKST